MKTLDQVLAAVSAGFAVSGVMTGNVFVASFSSLGAVLWTLEFFKDLRKETK